MQLGQVFSRCFLYSALVAIEELGLSKPVDVGSLKIGQYVVIEDEPCRIVEYEKSKPGT